MFGVALSDDNDSCFIYRSSNDECRELRTRERYGAVGSNLYACSHGDRLCDPSWRRYCPDINLGIFNGFYG